MTRVTRNSTLPPKAHRFVGCFDVLGFKNYVTSTSLDEVLGAYEQLIQEARYFTEIPVAKAYPGGGGRVDLEEVPYQIFSDTILIWSEGSSVEQIQNFLQSCCCLVSASVRIGLPLRGGVGFGECHMDTAGGIYVGKAIVDAFETEKIQEWIGVGLHDSCFDSPIGRKIASIDDVVPYAVPVKITATAPKYTLRWHGYAVANLEEHLQGLLAGAAGDLEAETKILNALRYCQEVERVI